MGRLDFPSTTEGFEEFKKFVKQYIGSNKMKLLLTRSEAVIRTKLATRYDSAYIKNLSEQQIKELETFVGSGMDVWHVEKFYWDEETKERKVE